MVRNLNINCQTEEKLKEIKDALETAAKILKFNNLHEFVRWQGSQSPEKLANALRNLRIEEFQLSTQAARPGECGGEGNIMTVVIHNQSAFNHGCQDWATVKMTSETTGTVVDVKHCTSCWQVGHDADHVFANIGEKVEIFSVDEYGESENWRFV